MSTNLRTRASWTFGLPRSVHAFGVNLLLLPLGIATSIVIARTVGPTGKGSLDLIVATSALLTLLLSMSLPQGVTYVVAQRPSTASTLAAQLVFVSLLQATIALLVLGVLRLTPHFPRFLPDWGPWIIGGVVLFVWVDLVSKFWAAILTGQQHIAIVNNAEFVGRVTQFVSVFVIAAVLYFSGKQLSVAVLFGVTVSASALINILLLASLDFRFQLSRDWSGLKAAVAFAIPNYAANVVQFLNYRLDVFVVGFFAGTASVGRYTLAVSLGQLLWLMSNSVAAVLLPKVAAATERDVSVRHTARVTRLCLWATAFCALVLAALATQAIPLLYGDAFRPSIAALLWILPGIVVFSIANVLAAYIAGIGKPRLNFVASGVALLVTIALDITLIPKLNIVGASIASTVSYTVSALLLVMFFMRETRASLREILIPTSDDVKMLLTMARLRLSSQSTI